MDWFQIGKWFYQAVYHHPDYLTPVVESSDFVVHFWSKFFILTLLKSLVELLVFKLYPLRNYMPEIYS